MTEKLDLVLFGATSFVGQLTAKCLADHLQTADTAITWGLAGRSQPKLEKLRESLGERYAGLPIIIADADNATELDAMCERTNVVVSTVGPYTLYGEKLIAACAASGTDYADLTGEVQWVHRMMARYEADAKASGARIVHCCGFDSVPSDMGVFYLQQQMKATYGALADDIAMRVNRIKGGISGGTAASMLNAVREASSDKTVLKVLTNPFSLCPPNHGIQAKQPHIKGPARDKETGVWLAPFIMGSVNEAVVRRSHVLLHPEATENFRYYEALQLGTGLKGRTRAYVVSAGMGAFMAGAWFAPSRYVIDRFFMPSPGQGPSSEDQQAGHYDIRVTGKTAKGEQLQVVVKGQGDPGYASTSRILSQAALTLATNQPAAPKGGFGTPASSLGSSFLDRLTRYAGLTFS